MGFSILNTLLLFIILQLFLLVGFLFTQKKGRKLSNRLLAFYFLLLGLNLTDGLLGYTGFYEKYPSFAHLEDGSALLLGLLLYFYVCSVIYRDFRLTSRKLLHFLPFIIFSVSFQLVYHSFSNEKQLLIQNAITNQSLPYGFYLAMLLVYSHVAGYFIISLRKLRTFEKQIRDLYSNVERITLKWLRFLIVAMLTIIIVSFVNVFIPFAGEREWFVPGFAILLGLFFVFVNTVVFKGLQQSQLFGELQHRPQKYQSSTMGNEEKEQLHSHLRMLMEREKPFLQPELSLEELATRLKTSSRKLSQVINEVGGHSFFDFVNSYRIREAAAILDSSPDPKLTVLEVLYQAGFNSKSSFNALFKKKMGVTPSAYRQRVLLQQKMRTTS